MYVYIFLCMCVSALVYVSIHLFIHLAINLSQSPLFSLYLFPKSLPVYSRKPISVCQWFAFPFTFFTTGYWMWLWPLLSLSVQYIYIYIIELEFYIILCYRRMHIIDFIVMSLNNIYIWLYFLMLYRYWYVLL